MVATNAPTNTINCDRTFLALMDSDKNGRIICHELRNAICWLLDVLGEHEGITQASGRTTGSNILYLNRSTQELAEDLKMSPEKLQKRLKGIRQKLFAEREKRVHPYKDDKILTDWNGLMIAALAQGARVLDEPRYGRAAKRAADFILENMVNNEGRLLHRYRQGEAGISGHIDDYVFLTWGLLELYETTFEVAYLERALDLNTEALEHFWDQVNGGFYFTADDGEKLLVRQKESYDGAIPSGNSVGMLNLLRLGRITANAELEVMAAKIGSALSESVRQAPSGHTQLMSAVDFGAGPAYEVVIAGKAGAQDTQQMLKALRGRFIPNKVVVLRDIEHDTSAIERLAEYTKYQDSIEGKATVCVCENYNCKLPTTDIDKMLELLEVK